MNFASEIFGNRQTLLWFLDYRIEQRLRPYEEALDWFLSGLFRAALPWDWRQGWHAFVADQSAQGRITVPQSVREMEVWIEGWAGFCGLLPRRVEQTAAAGTRSDELPGSVYIPLPPGLPMRQRIAAARARDAVAHKRRYEFYEERNRQVLVARLAAEPTPAGDEESQQTPTIVLPLPAEYRTKEQIALANAWEELERLRYRRIQEERTRQLREVQRAYGALLRRGYNKERRHDPGRRLSEDPIGIAGDSSKLSPQVENAATNATDLSSLRERAKPFEYVAGAIQLPAGLTAPVINSVRANKSFFPEIASFFSFGWQAVPSQFTGTFRGKVRQLCDEVGVVQIHRSIVHYTGGLPTDLLLEFANSFDWSLDKGIPYPHQAGKNTIVNPSRNLVDFLREAGGTGDVGHSGFFTDSPGLEMVHYTGSPVLYLQQDFELHFVCLRGLEKGATYGGVKWGHTFTLTNPAVNWTNISDYEFSSYHDQIFGPPSEIWKSIYRRATASPKSLGF